MNAALASDGVALNADKLIALRRYLVRQTGSGALSRLPGGFPSRCKGTGHQIADLREYQAGDDLRHLDPATSARRGALHIRQFQQERDRVTLLVADFRRPMFWGVSRALLSVAAAEALCLLGWSAIGQGGRVGLLAITPGAPVIVPARARVRGQLDVIGGLVAAHRAALSLVQASAQTAQAAQPLGAALSVAERLCPTGADVVIASSFEAEGPDFPAILDQLEWRRALRLLLVSDGEALPPGRYPVQRPGAGRQVLQIGRGPTAPGPCLVAGRPALRLSASDPLERLAAILGDAA